MKTAPLLNKNYWNEGTLSGLLASWTLNTVLKGFRSINAENLGSIGQRAAKLLAIKLWEWFDLGQTQIQACLHACTLFSLYGQRVCNRLRPRFECAGVESFSKFDGQQLCSPFIYRPQIFSIERSKPKLCQKFKN